jgi:hypothetical protein
MLRSRLSSGGLLRPTRCGARREFTANFSTSPSAPSLGSCRSGAPASPPHPPGARAAQHQLAILRDDQVSGDEPEPAIAHVFHGPLIPDQPRCRSAGGRARRQAHPGTPVGGASRHNVQPAEPIEPREACHRVARVVREPAHPWSRKHGAGLSQRGVVTPTLRSVGVRRRAPGSRN